MTTLRRVGIFGAVLMAFLLAPTATYGNPVYMENLLPGTTDWRIPDDRRASPTDWVTQDRSTTEIEGYASLTSVNLGDIIDLYVNTLLPGNLYSIEIYRLGWYGGAGGRLMLGPTFHSSGVQPACVLDAETRMTSCPWRNPVALTIPTDWVSGFYVAKLTDLQTNKQNYIIFVVRDDDRAADYLFLSAVNTYQAYNQYGGHSLYPRSREGVGDRPKATKVSFDRPYDRCVLASCDDHLVGQLLGTGEFFRWEASMMRFLEREGKDVSYGTNVDAHTSPGLLVDQNALLSVGHDEYWSWEMRENVEQARDRCVSLGFFSANSVYWQIRYEPSASGQLNRTIVAYKDSEYRSDPLSIDGIDANDYLITTLWRGHRIGSGGGTSRQRRPEDALIGVMYAFYPVNTDLHLSSPGHPLLAGTTETRLPGLVGYEADRMFGNAPPGTVRLSHSPIGETGDVYNCDVAVGTCFSDMTIYEAPSRALVFATGTIQWSWGLDVDDLRSPEDTRPVVFDANAQQITHNVLEAFRATSCDLDPGISLPPTPVERIGVSIGGVSSSGELAIIECLNNPASCWLTTRGIAPEYPHISINERSEMQQIPPIGFQLPVSADHTLVGSVYDFDTTASFRGSALVTLGYDAEIIPEHRELELAVLYLAEGNRGPEWRVAETKRDAKINAVQARLPALSTVSLALPPLTVMIDIKPGNDENTVNLNAAGVIPVAVLGSQIFDPASVDRDSIELAGEKVKVTGKNDKSHCHLNDINEDGFADLICQITNVSEYETVQGETVVTLEAKTLDGALISGTDHIRIVP